MVVVGLLWIHCWEAQWSWTHRSWLVTGGWPRPGCLACATPHPFLFRSSPLGEVQTSDDATPVRADFYFKLTISSHHRPVAYVWVFLLSSSLEFCPQWRLSPFGIWELAETSNPDLQHSANGFLLLLYLKGAVSIPRCIVIYDDYYSFCNHCLHFCWGLSKLLYVNFFIFLEYYMLANPDEKNDIIPEIMDAMNVADFVDDDIEQVTETVWLELSLFHSFIRTFI